jgi:hypothetical protein
MPRRLAAWQHAFMAYQNSEYAISMRVFRHFWLEKRMDIA